MEARYLLSASAFLPQSAPAAPVADHVGPDFQAGEVIVGFNAGANDQQIRGLYRAHGLTELEQLYGSQGVRRVDVSDQAVDAVMRALEKDPLVDYAEPNYIASAFATPNDPLYKSQWHFSNSSYGGINVEQAWDVTAGAGAVVAVLDTGVAYENYSDSAGTYYVAPDFSGTRFTAGYDFINNDAHANDDNSHGTHVAGTVAQSTNNSKGASGVAYDATIMPVKVLGMDGSGSYSAIANGIKWAADNGANVINLSLGGPNSSRTLENALRYAYKNNVTIVAAAGNEGQQGVSYPAAYDNYVIAVSATRFDEKLAYYSNYGSSIDLAAPGGDVTIDQNGDGYPDGVLQNTFNPNTQDTSAFGYYLFQGTSMAAPHVAGVAAMIVSQGVVDPFVVRDILQSTAEDKGAAGVDQYYGYGIVDAAAAIASITSSSNTNTPPVAGNDSASSDEDLAVAINVLANDSDAEGDPLTVTATTSPSHGSVAINGDGTITYTPDANYNGTDLFTYTISDGGGSDTASVAVTVNPVNDAPVAANDSYQLAQDTTLSIAAPGVLSNDSDADGDALSSVVVTEPASGTLNLNAEGSFSYTPNAGFTGTDGFSYTAKDAAGASSTATVEIAVKAITDVINFNDYTIDLYGGSTQNPSGDGVATVQDDGTTLHLSGNLWRKIDLPYSVTSNTVLEFDFRSSSEGEVHAIGFDDDLSLMVGGPESFKLYGTQSWGLPDYDDYASSDWKRYQIPVGQFFTGDFQYLHFGMDHDVQNPTGESYFSNINVYENSTALATAAEGGDAVVALAGSDEPAPQDPWFDSLAFEQEAFDLAFESGWSA